MRKRAFAYPELADPKPGRRFRRRPGKAVIDAFLRHVHNTGSPHTWTWITTTPHPKGEAPAILAGFSIPLRMRSGKDTRAPCSICSPCAPKFDSGFLVFCSDGLVRIIGHECGHEHFGEGYAAALRQHSEENAEEAAQDLLNERMPRLARTLLEAVTVARSLSWLLDFRERAFARITQTAIKELRRARVGDQLTVMVQSDAKDDQGRRLPKAIVVATVQGLDGLAPPPQTLGDLMQAIRDAGAVWIVERDELEERLAGLTRQQKLAAARVVRRLDEVLERANKVRNNLAALLTAESLRGLSVWGRHSQATAPFWIELVGDRKVFLSKGLRPLYWDRGPYLTLPDASVYQPIEVQ